MMDNFASSEMQEAMTVDSDESSHPISFPVTASSDIRRIFDPISYSKGACIAGMINGILGDRTFRAGLKSYLKKYQFSNAVQDDLWDVMTQEAHSHQVLAEDLHIKTIMDTWTLQAGFPVVTVTRSNTSSDIVLTQHRYMLSTSNVSDSSLWYIPINFESQGHRTQDKMPTHWMNKTKSLTIRDAVNPKHWMYVNIQRIGYYRVNYDKNSWLMLCKNFYDLPEITQGQLLDDSLQLARAQQLSYDIPLWLLQLLSSSEKYNVVQWSAAAQGIGFLTNMLSREPANEQFQVYMRFILTPIFDFVGFQESTEDSHVLKLHRMQIISYACFFGVESCVSRSRSLFNDWQRDPENFK